MRQATHGIFSSTFPFLGSFSDFWNDECVFHYTQSYPDDYVDWEEQISVKWNDPMLKIEWPINNPILSERDK